MVDFRGATDADLPRLVEMGHAMHGESRHHRSVFIPEKFAGYVQQLIPQGFTFVAEKEGQVVGAFIGGVAENFFDDELFSYDLLTYVTPEHRNGMLGVMLIRRYINLAQAMGIKPWNTHIGVSAGIATERTERLYEALGFIRIGGGYVLDV